MVMSAERIPVNGSLRSPPNRYTQQHPIISATTNNDVVRNGDAGNVADWRGATFEHRFLACSVQPSSIMRPTGT